MIKNALLLLISVLVSFLVVEAVLRTIYAPPGLELRMKLVAAGIGGGDNKLAFDLSTMVHEPLQTVTLTHAEYENQVSIDHYGFRNPCSSEPIAGIMVGDSSVFGVGVDDDETFQCAYAQRGVNTYSLGVSGAAPRHYIRLIETHGVPLKQQFSFSDDFFVQYFLSLGNDFQQLVKYGEKQEKKGQSKEKEKRRGKPFLKRANKFVFHDSPLRYSYLLQMLKLAAVQATPQCEGCSWAVLRGGDRIYRTDIDDEEVEQHIEGVARFIDSAYAAANQAGATRVEFVLLRGAHIINEQRLERELALLGAAAEEFNLDYQSEILERAAIRRPEVTVIDTTDCLKEYPEAAALHYKFDGHFTSLGVETFISCLTRPGLAAAGR